MEANLSVKRSEFEPAFTLLRKLCKAGPAEEAVLSYDGQCLHLDLGGMVVTPAAEGDWRGQARVSARFILALAKVLPGGDPVRFQVEKGQLRVGTSLAPCIWQSPWARTIDLPENPSHQELLSLPLQHELFEIEASGYAGLLRNSENWRDTRIQEAVKALEGFGVTRADLMQLVTTALRRAHKPPTP